MVIFNNKIKLQINYTLFVGISGCEIFFKVIELFDFKISVILKYEGEKYFFL